MKWIETQQPRQLSRQLRQGRGNYLENRRGVIATSMVAIGSMALISLYQTGLIRHLPDPPLPYIDSDRIDAAGEAYARLGTPDGPLGLNSYGTTLALAAAGGRNRAREKPWLPLLLAAKTLFDAGQAIRLTIVQWRDFRAFCIWCLLASAATFISVPLALPEAIAALRHLLEKTDR